MATTEQSNMKNTMRLHNFSFPTIHTDTHTHILFETKARAFIVDEYRRVKLLTWLSTNLYSFRKCLQFSQLHVSAAGAAVPAHRTC